MFWREVDFEVLLSPLARVLSSSYRRLIVAGGGLLGACVRAWSRSPRKLNSRTMAGLCQLHSADVAEHLQQSP